MPSRYIREGWLDSARIAKASGAGGPGAEVLMLRLMLVADDWGRLDGRPVVILRKCWPSEDEFDGAAPSKTQLAAWLKALADADLISLYEIDGKPFVQIERFGQRTRAKQSKFPAPPGVRPQDDGNPSARWLTPGVQSADKAPTGSRHLQARSVSRSRSLSMPRTIDPVDKNRPPVDKSAGPSDPPGGSVARFAQAALTKIPTPPADPPAETPPEEPPETEDGANLPTGTATLAPPAVIDDEDWSATPQAIEAKGAKLGMPRLPYETDQAFTARINARLALG